MDLGLSGGKALVTGGTRGIGRAIVERLVAEGMTVAVCARGQDGIDALTAAHGADEVVGRVVDVSDHAALAAWATERASCNSARSPRSSITTTRAAE